MGWTMDGTPCTIREEPDRHGVNMALRIVDRDGNEVASCFYSEGNTPPIDVVEKTTAYIPGTSTNLKGMMQVDFVILVT